MSSIAPNYLFVHRYSETAVDANDENWSKSLPRSWKDQKLITNVKETDVSDETIKMRQQMVSTMSPAQLSEIRGFSDFPVPVIFKSRSRSGSVAKERKRDRR